MAHEILWIYCHVHMIVCLGWVLMALSACTCTILEEFWQPSCWLAFQSRQNKDYVVLNSAAKWSPDLSCRCLATINHITHLSLLRAPILSSLVSRFPVILFKSRICDSTVWAFLSEVAPTVGHRDLWAQCLMDRLSFCRTAARNFL